MVFLHTLAIPFALLKLCVGRKYFNAFVCERKTYGYILTCCVMCYVYCMCILCKNKTAHREPVSLY